MLFVIPFTIGVIILFTVLIFKAATWIAQLPSSDKIAILKGIFSFRSIKALGEIISESLLHKKIFGTSIRLGYMHMSLAFGWFLLIVVGKIEGAIYLDTIFSPPYIDVFFKRFFPEAHDPLFSFIMDLLLLFVLSGLGFAVLKRYQSKRFGMKKTTVHSLGDRIAITSLWAIFPLRLLAESFNSSIYDSGSFLTGTLGKLWALIFPLTGLEVINNCFWWLYSISLGLFFVALLFSRYTHIFAEIGLIFLRAMGVKTNEVANSYTNFQLTACSRCGICIDPCQLGQENISNNIQSVYFIRDSRYGKLESKTTDNCLMCGRCEQKCPVGLDLNTLRMSQKHKDRATDIPQNYSYLNGKELSCGSGKVGYFSGCMGALTPQISNAMEKIFSEAGIDVWYADKEGGACCGRPQKLSGNYAAAEQLVAYNKQAFAKHGITTLVTSCPICLKSFKEDYHIEGIEVIHHSQYILSLIESGKITREKSDTKYGYHDPCELGRGSNIYEEPRKVINSVGSLKESSQNRENGLCCGGSLANTTLELEQKNKIAKATCSSFQESAIDVIITACPLCKKSLERVSDISVKDIAEIIAK